MTEQLLPEFGPADADGFRTFVLYSPDGDESIRVSVHLENHRKYLAKRAQDATGYLPEEDQSLRDAAALAAATNEARKNAGPIDADGAFGVMSSLLPEFVTEDIEKHFPRIAQEALQIASDVCMKHSLNRTVKAMNAPGIYDEAFVDLLLQDFKAGIMRALGVEKRRPVETYAQMKKTRDAVTRVREDEEMMKRLAGRRPSPEDVASKVDERTNERTVRRWAEAVGLSWSEWLRACGWTE